MQMVHLEKEEWLFQIDIYTCQAKMENFSQPISDYVNLTGYCGGNQTHLENLILRKLCLKTVQSD